MVLLLIVLPKSWNVKKELSKFVLEKGFKNQRFQSSLGKNLVSIFSCRNQLIFYFFILMPEILGCFSIPAKSYVHTALDNTYSSNHFQ